MQFGSFFWPLHEEADDQLFQRLLTGLAVHPLEAWLAPADVLIEHIPSSGRCYHLTQPIVPAGVWAAGTWENGKSRM